MTAGSAPNEQGDTSGGWIARYPARYGKAHHLTLLMLIVLLTIISGVVLSFNQKALFQQSQRKNCEDWNTLVISSDYYWDGSMCRKAE